jgi:hypothetical protein
LAYTSVDEIINAGLHDFIDDLQARLNNIGEAIFHAFVLYADLVPVETPVIVPVTPQPGAWHRKEEDEMVMQQQQQQQ